MSTPIPRNRPALLRFLAAFLVATALALAAAWLLLANLGLHHPLASLTFVAVVFAYTVAIGAAAFRFVWRPALAPFPARQPSPGAIHRRYQSFGVSIVNMGLSIHAAVDDEYLHLVPLSIWQILGARPASIPWSALTPAGRGKRVARLGACRLEGPEWCMKLIAPERPGSVTTETAEITG